MDSSASLNVLLTDDHTLFRKGMTLMLEGNAQIGKIYEAANGREALKHLREIKNIDIVLIDMDMPLMNGLETSKRIVDNFPEVKIIMISMHEELAVISEVIEVGVHSYLLKSASQEEVDRAIDSVVNNDFYYNQLVSNALNSKAEKKEVEKVELADISPRETEVLQLICKELSMKEISEKLFLSEQTVQTHRKNLMRKTNSRNAVGLVRYAIQKGIANF